MGTFTSWFGMTLVIIAVAVGVNEVRQDRDRLRSVAIVLGIGLFVVFIPPLQLLRRAEWRAQFGTWSAAAFPPRVDFCGDRYSPAGPDGIARQGPGRTGWTIQGGGEYACRESDSWAVLASGHPLRRLPFGPVCRVRPQSLRGLLQRGFRVTNLGASSSPSRW